MDKTKSHMLFEDLVIEYYIPFEVWYVSTVIDKVLVSHEIPVNAHF